MRFNSIVFLLAALMNLSCGGSDVNPDDKEEVSDNIIYKGSDVVFSNPERGFVHSWPVFSEGDPVSMAALNNLKAENVSMIWRVYYLEKFKDSPLSDAQLGLLSTDFSRMRDAGIKCIFRFAYTDALDKGDAPIDIVTTHLDQLAPIFQEHADVIAFAQAGFIGAWGEWHTSTNNLTSLANKKIVVNKLLEVLPKEVKIQLRTPLFKQEVFGVSDAMDVSVGYSDQDIARIGFHNDCFMGSADDYGTYQNIEAEKLYISKEAIYVPTGGETCPPSGIPSASCTTAETEMSLLKWSYLNLDWYGPVLQVWRDNSCFEDFERDLGYRLALKSANLESEALADGTFVLSASIANLGFAPVYHFKNTYLVLRAEDGTVYKAKLDFDVRHVIPGVEYNLKEEVNLSGIPAGDYELLLKIEDQSESLADIVEFSIRLANEGVWESSTGMNKLLHMLSITQ